MAEWLSEGSYTFRTFLHFFDVQFLEVKQAHLYYEEITQEARIATRCAMLCSEEVLIPASSFFETRVCEEVVSEFRSIYEHGTIWLVGAAANIEEFIYNKLRQYDPSSDQYKRYSQTDLGHLPPFRARQRSSTKDIKTSWAEYLNAGRIGELFDGIRYLPPRGFERRWQQVPDALDQRAFVVRYVLPLLLKDKRHPTIVNRLHRIINGAYFSSYVDEFGASTVHDLIYLASPHPVPSAGPPIPYRRLLLETRKAGLLSRIAGCDAKKLLQFKQQEAWIHCLLTATAGDAPLLPLSSTPSLRVETPHMDQSLTITTKEVNMGHVFKNIRNARVMDASELKGKIHAIVITVRDDEYDAMEAKLGETRRVPGKNSYKYGEIAPSDSPPISVLLTRVVGGQGNLKAQSVATNAIIEIDPAWLILVGIAGGRPDNEFSLGDVVVATYLHDFSFRAAKECIKRSDDYYQVYGGPMHRDVERFLQTGPVGRNGEDLRELAGFLSDASLLEHPQVYPETIQEAERYYGNENHQKKVRETIDRRFPNGRRNGGPIVWLGSCANGNVIVKDSRLLRQWQRSAAQVTHVETELAGVYEAARATGRENYPILAIRALSDIIGFTRHADWTGYACRTAAAYAYAVLKSGLIDFSRNLPPNPR